SPLKAMHFGEAELVQAIKQYVKFPVVVQPKLDGIRCIIHPQFGPVSRTLKPIPNKHIRDTLQALDIPYMDGEILLRSEGHTFQQVSSGIMSGGGTPDFVYHVFDYFEHPNEKFLERY